MAFPFVNFGPMPHMNKLYLSSKSAVHCNLTNLQSRSMYLYIVMFLKGAIFVWLTTKKGTS